MQENALIALSAISLENGMPVDDFFNPGKQTPLVNMYVIEIIARLLTIAN